MKLEFKLDDLYDILDDNEYLHEESAYTKDKVGYIYNLWLFQVVIPELHISFRMGDAYVRNPEVDDSMEPDAYDYMSGGTVIYEEGEQDLNQYVFDMAAGETFTIREYCRQQGIKCDDVSQLMAYIEVEDD